MRYIFDDGLNALSAATFFCRFSCTYHSQFAYRAHFFFSFPRASFFLVFVSLRFRVLLLLLKFSFHFVFLFSSLDWYRPFPTNCLSLHWMPCMHYLITISITVKFIVNIFLCSVSHVAFYCTHSSHRLKLQFNENKTEIK